MGREDVLDSGTVGRCPNCHNDIGKSEVFITFERYERRTIFAECDNCGRVVEPRQ